MKENWAKATSLYPIAEPHYNGGCSKSYSAPYRGQSVYMQWPLLSEQVTSWTCNKSYTASAVAMGHFFNPFAAAAFLAAVLGGGAVGVAPRCLGRPPAVTMHSGRVLMTAGGRPNSARLLIPRHRRGISSAQAERERSDGPQPSRAHAHRASRRPGAVPSMEGVKFTGQLMVPSLSYWVTLSTCNTSEVTLVDHL